MTIIKKTFPYQARTNPIHVNRDDEWYSFNSKAVRAYGIYRRIVDVSETQRERFLMQKRVRKYRTKHFSCGIVFIIYILRQFIILLVFYFNSFQNAIKMLKFAKRHREMTKKTNQ